MANNDNDLLIRIGLIDEKRKPNVIPLYIILMVLTKYMLIHKPTNKVHNLRMNNSIAFCIDDPKFPFKRLRGKGTVKIHEDVSYDIPIAKKFIMKSI